MRPKNHSRIPRNSKEFPLIWEFFARPKKGRILGVLGIFFMIYIKEFLLFPYTHTFSFCYSFFRAREGVAGNWEFFKFLPQNYAPGAVS